MTPAVKQCLNVQEILIMTAAPQQITVISQSSWDLIGVKHVIIGAPTQTLVEAKCHPTFFFFPFTHRQ